MRHRRLLSRWMIGRMLLALIALLALIQIVPYGRTHGDGAVTMAARFPDARTHRLFSEACGDCHSERTTWPWYASVAPASWLVERDVNAGRSHLDVSRWNAPQPALDEIMHQVKGGGMPPVQYKLIHGDSRLSTAERRELALGLRRLYATDPPLHVRHGHGD